MTKEIINIVKGILLYYLKSGFHVGKTQKPLTKKCVTYYAGFWSDKNELEENLVPITRAVKRIIENGIKKECKKGFVDIKKVELDTTYHSDYNAKYWNIGITFGGY